MITAILVVSGWLAIRSFPLLAQPQTPAAQSFLAASPTGAAGPEGTPAEPAGVLQNGRYHHTLSGVEFDLPFGWSLGQTRLVDGDPREVTVLHDPDNKAIFVSASMVPAETPVASIPEALSKTVPHLLERRGSGSGVHAAKNYKIRDGSVEESFIGGHQALRAIGDYEQGGQNISELLVWIFTEHTRTFFFAKTLSNDLDSLRVPFEQLVQSARIP
jgi:hypothetical protein